MCTVRAPELATEALVSLKKCAPDEADAATCQHRQRNRDTTNAEARHQRGDVDANIIQREQ